jgi:hypothetical protein
MTPNRPTQRHAWWSRTIFPDSVAASLSWGAERWRPPHEFPEYQALLDGAARLGIPVDARYELTQHLLEEVVAAAAAIEYTVEKLLAAVALADSEVASLQIQWPEGEPEHGSHISANSLWSAYAEFNDLLTWIRALEERIERKDRAFRNQAVGLLPSLAKGPLQVRVADLFADLKADLLDVVRPLTNYVLHASVLPAPMSNSARVREGRLFLEIPDFPKDAKTIRTRFHLSWDDHLTADSFALSALQTISMFVDRLLDAFEANTPERLRKSADAASVENASSQVTFTGTD